MMNSSCLHRFFFTRTTNIHAFPFPFRLEVGNARMERGLRIFLGLPLKRMFGQNLLVRSQSDLDCENQADGVRLHR